MIKQGAFVFIESAEKELATVITAGSEYCKIIVPSSPYPINVRSSELKPIPWWRALWWVIFKR